MLDAALTDGTARRPVVFEAFARHLPDGARYGLVYGADRVVEAIMEFRFGDDELHWLSQRRIVSRKCLEFLASYRFGGDVDAYPDGEAWFPGSPLLVVRGSFAEAVLLETVLLSVLNHGCSVATQAARLREAAGDKGLIEMGSRRTHPDAAVDAAAAAWLGGFDSTSNLAAGERYGVPTAGTASHAWILAHDDEMAAFEAQIAALGTETTLLVDTYDIRTGIDRAVAAAQSADAAGPGAIRIDSGDLGREAVSARRQLDAAGATGTRIVVSGDLNVEAIRGLVAARVPVDALGVGTSLVAVPPVGTVYKLVAVAEPDGAWRAVAKTSVGKGSVGGVKRAWRRLDGGRAVAEVILRDEQNGPTPGPGRPVIQRVVSAGEDVRTSSSAAQRLARGRARAKQVAGEMAGSGDTSVVRME